MHKMFSLPADKMDEKIAVTAFWHAVMHIVNSWMDIFLPIACHKFASCEYRTNEDALPKNKETVSLAVSTIMATVLSYGQCAFN